MKNCIHQKVYAPWQLESYPPIHPWICRLCGEEGEETAQTAVFDEYELLVAKKRLENQDKSLREFMTK